MLGGSRGDWLTLIAIKVAALAVLYAIGWLWAAIFLAFLATCLALGVFVAFDIPVDRDRRAILDEVGAILRRMRDRGIAEPAIRAFVASTGDAARRRLAHALFGPDPIRTDGRRNPVSAWIDVRLRRRGEARLRARFVPMIEAELVAKKINLMTARRKSKRIAEALRIVGDEVRLSSLAAILPPDASTTLQVKPRPIPDLLREAVDAPDKLLTAAESELVEEKGPHFLVRVLEAAVGPRVRTLLGFALVGCFFLWADQVGMISGRDIKAKTEQAINEQDVTRLKDVSVDLDRVTAAETPLAIEGVPGELGRHIHGYGVGVAGLILIVSAFAGGLPVAFFAGTGAVVAWFGPSFGLPGLRPLSPNALAAAIGAGLLVIGLLVPRRR